MGLLLSVLVVCVGVLEAISCVRHVQHGYLPYSSWVSSRMRPSRHEHVRRKPNEDDSSDESSDELSRILHNGGGVHINRKDSPSYGLTPILTEHRRHTPILCGGDDEDEVQASGYPKYVENNIDEYYSESSHANLLTDGFRPISPPEPEEPLDESYVASSGKFLEVPPEDSPLQRSSSEETLHDPELEGRSPSDLEEPACPVEENASPSRVVDAEVDGGRQSQTQDLVFKIDEASPPVAVEEFAYPDSQFSQTIHLDEDGNNVTNIPEEDEDLDLSSDPVFNLVSAAAYILRNEAEYERSDTLPRKGEQQVGTTSVCRPLSMAVGARIPTPQAHRDSMPLSMDAAARSSAPHTHRESKPPSVDVTARIPTPQAHRESMPFDLIAAHASSRSGSSSRPETPSTPKRKADISWPVFHPEPVIKRPGLTHSDLQRGGSIEEDADSPEGELVTSQTPATDAPVDITSHSIDRSVPSIEVDDHSAPVPCSSDLDQPVSSSTSATSEVTAETPDSNSNEKSVPSYTIPDGPSSEVNTEAACVEDQCSRTVLRSTASAPVTPFVTVPGCGRVCLHRRDADDCPCPASGSVDRFGRFTTRAHKGCWRRRHASLERTPAVDTTLKGSVVKSKSLPDFFFEENAVKLEGASPAAPAAPVTPVAPAAPAPAEEEPESEAVGKDITRKESSIKRRRGYRKKERSTWTPSRAKNRVSQESVVTTSTETDEDYVDLSASVDSLDASDATAVAPASLVVQAGAILNSALAPVEVLHHAHVQPESAVFATTTQQPKKKLRKPAKAESFEEAPPLLAQPSDTRPPQEVVATPPQETTTQGQQVVAQPSDTRQPPKVVATQPEKTTTQGQQVVAPPSDSRPPQEVVATPPEKSTTQVQQVVAQLSDTRPPPEVVATPPQKKTTTTETQQQTQKTTHTKTIEKEPPQVKSNSASVTKTPSTAPPPQPPPPREATSDVTHSSRAPAVKADETTANIDDEEEEEDDEEEEEESEAMDVKHPQQSSAPAPFWLIFSGEYTKAMSKDWHSGHFCCWQCDESLTGQRYVLRDDHPYCIKCYESVFANMCEECSKTIGIDSKDLSYKDKHWHEACFLCNKCRVSLVDKQFGSKADKIYCSNCYDAQFASRCDGCGEIFRAGTKKMEYKTRQWHEKCFCCCVCKSAIGTKSFIPREQEIYCATCYEEKFATRCVKCNKIITSGGVTYKNEPWHRECFTCTHCNTSLAGQRFTSRDEKPYCAECFGELFAKRCTACVKPITGIGGTRFISFEDRHWHNDCFICASCRTSLVGRGFITDAEDIICPECAKQKLM